ncbi:MAG: hypothetical protein J0H29_12705 [Sphingobacteriales bacterium]|nr:hypothetical protein [Sphingobacteriales bacterium]
MLKKWLQISFLNLAIVALLGVVMRYKILYPLPFVDQKKFLHAHSHFAFSGWVTLALMSLLISKLGNDNNAIFRKYRPVLIANLLTAYGMLLSFPFEGYGLISIIFSTLSIFVSYWFAIQYRRDLNRLGEKKVSSLWFKAAVLFNVISSAGAFTLAGIMATRSTHTGIYLAAVYFFLHFQYNGWFFFACMGLLTHKLEQYAVKKEQLLIIYRLFVYACVPAYMLSVLWVKLPVWLYMLVIVAVVLQLTGWIITVKHIRKLLQQKLLAVERFPRILLALCGLAFSIKLVLQSASVVPSLSHLAFGFRPIVIGYLHLVLLGVITLFIISYTIAAKLIHINIFLRAGVITATAVILLNEIFLMIQGVADISYLPIPAMNFFLLIAAVILFLGFLTIFCSQQFKQKSNSLIL